ncbi:hypothetical protein Q4512_15790 [Oceanihabitans sp. 2_MG-2023]|uniref:hypothetical protein n=1 Tax=Oceanihabitans sp. 2_MG-2023 TaxID=3062661 RepID=UPI0026E1C0C1|nr:hypothetical protein [Oceanihabitans sp. 2_MG-2023]MDO6598380.1 hypothetical protein [Oceanihabitans sp. 2_MG-2023]
MKFIFTFLVALTCVASSFSQESTPLSFENFETDFFTYNPVQKKHVTNDHFSFAEYVITETKKSLNSNVENYSVIHYWNILTALDMLKEDKATLILAFQKLVELEGSCKYIVNYKNKISFYKTITAMYDHYYSQCKKSNSLVGTH